MIDPTLDREREMLAAHPLVIGCDEVGRGALAGPVCVGAAVIGNDEAHAGFPVGLRDSKLVTERRRGALASTAAEWVQAHALGWASAAEIDEFGIIAALGIAAQRAFEVLRAAGIPVEQAVVLLDGNHDYVRRGDARPARVVTQVKGDRDCASIAAASLLAKVARDDRMRELHHQEPLYEWDRNKGYGSAAHRSAISRFGVSVQHRRSWNLEATPALW